MSTIGWMGDPPDAPPMPLTEHLLGMKQRGPGDALEIAAARSRATEARELREAAEGAPDPDEIAAAMIGRGLAPGMISDLSMKLGDTVAELESEREKIARGARRQEIAMREHAAGRIDAWGVQRMLDGDSGDAQRAAQLERRAEGLRRQLADAQAMMAPQRERVADPVAEAGRRAHELFAEVTRAKLAAAREDRPVRPFGSASRGGDAVRAEPVTCPTCLEMGASETESFAIHHSDADGNPLAVPEAELAESDSQEAGRYQPVAYR